LADVGEGFLAEGQAEVAGQNGGGVAEAFAVQGPALGLVELAEPAVYARSAAAGVRPVDDVVVDQGCRLEQLKRGACCDDVLRRGGAARSAPPQ
jgi:hypothetical protein